MSQILEEHTLIHNVFTMPVIIIIVLVSLHIKNSQHSSSYQLAVNMQSTINFYYYESKTGNPS